MPFFFCARMMDTTPTQKAFAWPKENFPQHFLWAGKNIVVRVSRIVVMEQLLLYSADHAL
jgi:hypothetical protein